MYDNAKMFHRRHFLGMSLLAGAVCPATLRASTVLVVPTTFPDAGMGIDQANWTKTSAALVATGPIVISPYGLDDLATLESYTGLWVDLRSTTDALSANESANLSAFVQTGRRVVLIGENSNFTTWDSSILSALGGTYSGGNYSGYTPTRSYVSLTTGVQSLQVSAGGVAADGTSLFEDRVATVWGPAQNAVVLLDSDALSDAAQSVAGNAKFSSNLVNWVSGGIDQTDSWKNMLGGVWNGNGAWSGGAMPSVADTASFNLGQNGAGSGGYTVTLASPKAMANLNILADKVTLSLPAGSALTVTSAVNVAPPVNEMGALSLTGGSATQVATVAVGSISLGDGAGMAINTGVAVDVAGIVSVASGATLTQNGGMLVVDGNITGGGGMTQSTGSTTATCVRLNSLDLSGGTLAIAAKPTVDPTDTVSVLDSLSLAQSGSTFLEQLDLGSNDLIVENGDLAMLSAALLSGYDNGRWDGPGISSSVAFFNPGASLQLIQNNNGNGQPLYGDGAPLGLFDGQSPDLDAILIRYIPTTPTPEPATLLPLAMLVALRRHRQHRGGD